MIGNLSIWHIDQPPLLTLAGSYDEALTGATHAIHTAAVVALNVPGTADKPVLIPATVHVRPLA